MNFKNTNYILEYLIFKLSVERIKLANILKETRNFKNSSNSKKANEKESEPEPKKTKRTRIKSQKKIWLFPDTKKTEEETVESIENFPDLNDCSIISNNNDIENNSNEVDCEENQRLENNESGKKRSKMIKSPEKVTQNQNQNFSKINSSKSSDSFVQLLSSSNLINLFTNKQPQQSMVIDNNGRIIPTNLSSLFMPSPSISPFQYVSQILPQQQTYQPNSNLILPASFNGTILYHPTIHIHNGAKNTTDMSNYKKIAPKKKE